jgi:predicted RNase H-like nuclease (RuvC/YqgF family)
MAESTDGQTSMEEVKKETQELIQTLKSYSAEQRDEAVQETREALEKLDKRIDALEKDIDRNWDEMDASAREQARESLKALRRQRIKLAEWYGSLKTSSMEAWEHMKKGFSEAYKALYDAWQKSEKEFGEH